MAVKDWLPWVGVAAGGYVLLEASGLLRGNVVRGAEEADRTFPVSLGDRLVPQLLGQLLDREFVQPGTWHYW